MLHSQNNLPFFEVFLATPIEVCERRDVKGLYKRARAGQIKNFTGISAIYENPTNPDLILNTELYSVQECVSKCVQMLASAVSDISIFCKETMTLYLIILF